MTLADMLADIQRRLAVHRSARSRAVARVIDPTNPDVGATRMGISMLDYEIASLVKRERELQRIMAREEKRNA